MARKLFLLVALMGLATLALAPASSAATYELIPQADPQDYTWFHNYGEGNFPWDAGTSFVAGAPQFFDSIADWKLGYDGPSGQQPYTNEEGDYYTIVDGGTTYEMATIFFGETKANPNFFVNMAGVPQISSTNTTFTYNAKYTVTGTAQYTMTVGTITGTGTNDLTGEDFMFTASLIDTLGNHSQSLGYMDSFTLKYPYNASSVPIPGTALLFGTGLLGLFCLGRRRKG